MPGRRRTGGDRPDARAAAGARTQHAVFVDGARSGRPAIGRGAILAVVGGARLRDGRLRLVISRAPSDVRPKPAAARVDRREPAAERRRSSAAPRPARPSRRRRADHRGAGHRVDAVARSGGATGRDKRRPRPNTALPAADLLRRGGCAARERGARRTRSIRAPARRWIGGGARARAPAPSVAAPPPRRTRRAGPRRPARARGQRRRPDRRPAARTRSWAAASPRSTAATIPRRCAAAARRSPPAARSAATCWWATPTTASSASRMRCASTRPRWRWIRERVDQAPPRSGRARRRDPARDHGAPA